MKNKQFKGFPYERLFKLITISNKLDKTNLSSNGKTPVYSSETSNNGIIGYTDKQPDFIIDEIHPIYIVFGDHTRTFNIATESFSVMDNVKVLEPIIKNIEQLLYICCSWKKGIPNRGYARHWSLAKDVNISLPIKKEYIPDFDVIEHLFGGGGYQYAEN